MEHSTSFGDPNEHLERFRFTNLIDLLLPRWKLDGVAHVVPRHHYNSMGRAMRYYRVWIYISCIVTVIPAIILACAVGWIFSSDYFQLLPLQIYDWTFIYLYLALLYQICVGPALGCWGARKLNQRVLWTFWASMVALCVSDAIIGVIWTARLIQLNSQLMDHLKEKLDTFGNDDKFTSVWNDLQSDNRCCGVSNASDFFNTAWHLKRKLKDGATGLVYQSSSESLSMDPSTLYLPDSCCSSLSYTSQRIMGNCTLLNYNLSHLPPKWGCYLPLHTWIHAKGDILFVIGYAILGFIRASIAFCLYSEIKHFVRKIYIRGVPSEMQHPSVTVGLDLVNFQRHNSQKRQHHHSTTSAIPLHTRANDGSLRRWSFMKHWKHWGSFAPVEDHPQDPLSPSTSKLKPINEETTAML